MSALLISVRFHDGRYHGSGEWPPSPARVFQALVAGIARGENLPEDAKAAFEWLETLDAPAIAAPSAFSGRGFRNFVPNNDLDAVGGDPARVGEIRAAKIVRPRHFDAAASLLYAWTFPEERDAERHARTICEIAAALYQLGRGVDMAWATGEVVGQADADERLLEHRGVVWRPSQGGAGRLLSCPRLGSLASLAERFTAMRGRFKVVGSGKNRRPLFKQAPKPNFKQVPYNSPSEFLLFEIRNAKDFAPQALERIVALTEKIRDRAVARLKGSAWRRDDPKRDALADKIFIGREATEADKARRIRITPLPSIGHAQTERSIRRVLVTVPPGGLVATRDIAWSFSGLVLADPATGEVSHDDAELVAADDRTMLAHYGIEDAPPARLWRTVTPSALPERARRRRIDPRRMREDAKGGPERAREDTAAAGAVRQALRHAGIDTRVQAIRGQREPFEGKGARAEAFAKETRFAKERLWHVEITFAEPRAGPLLIGDGRNLGLGLMAPVRGTDGIFVFAIAGGLERADPIGLARALRRAVMARVQAQIGPKHSLSPFFTGHAADGAPARFGRHEHLVFVFDAPRRRLLIVAPHILERRAPSRSEYACFPILEDALHGFRELRAGKAGCLALVPNAVDMSCDPLFARSPAWRSLTPYRVTRHARLNGAAAALEADLLAECRRAGLPRPRIEIADTFAKPGAGLFGHATLRFHSAAPGPILLGRDRHFGGGLFAPAT